MTAATGRCTMSCGHEFHMTCIVRWMQKPDGASTCPYCRAEPSDKERLVAAPEESDESDEEEDEGEEIDNVTALMDAASNGNLDAIVQLLGQGDAIDAKDSDGDTALVYAAMNGEDACVVQLLAAGADLLNLCKPYDPDRPPSLNLALLAACQCNSRAAVAAALVAGADPNCAHPLTGMTPLMEAVAGDDPLAIIDILLSRGASVFAVDCDGWNIFMWFAEKCDDTDVMASLLEAAGPAFKPVPPAVKIQAAKKIQAVWRGHSARQLLKTERIVALTLTEMMITIAV